MVIIVIRLRARTDFNPVGAEGAIALRKFLERLPNLKELRYISSKNNLYWLIIDLHFPCIGCMETNSKAVTSKFCHR